MADQHSGEIVRRLSFYENFIVPKGHTATLSYNDDTSSGRDQVLHVQIQDSDGQCRQEERVKDERNKQFDKGNIEIDESGSAQFVNLFISNGNDKDRRLSYLTIRDIQDRNAKKVSYRILSDDSEKPAADGDNDFNDLIVDVTITKSA